MRKFLAHLKRKFGISLELQSFNQNLITIREIFGGDVPPSDVLVVFIGGTSNGYIGIKQIEDEEFLQQHASRQKMKIVKRSGTVRIEWI